MFIAEISSNHDRDLNRCLQLVSAASKAGFDAIKFQAFKVESLFAKEILLVSQEHRKRAEWTFPIEFLAEIKKKCIFHNIKLGITPFYLDAVSYCAEYVDFFKIASYELLWDELIKHCCSTKKPLYISTGMANMDEVKNCVRNVKNLNFDQLCMMHCVSSYPAKGEELNLSAIESMRRELEIPVGWSDHSHKKEVILAAVLKWKADVVEMHLDLDGKGAEFEPGHCWLPHEAEEVIKICKSIKDFEGNGLKQPSLSEQEERLWRTDPRDGLRPFFEIREKYKGK